MHISADTLRKELFPVPQYDKTASKIVWEACVSQAQQSMADGKTVVWDAVFGHEHRRQEVREIAQEYRYGTVFLYVFCGNDMNIKTRLDARTDNASDADYSVYCALKNSFQSPEAESTIFIDNSSDLESLYAQVLQKL